MSEKKAKDARRVEAKKAKLADELTVALDEMMAAGAASQKAQQTHQAAGAKVGRIKQQIEALKDDSKGT